MIHSHHGTYLHNLRIQTHIQLTTQLHAHSLLQLLVLLIRYKYVATRVLLCLLLLGDTCSLVNQWFIRSELITHNIW